VREGRLLNILLLRFREVILSILPIDVLVLHFTIAPLEGLVIYRFLTGSAVLPIGLTLFLIQDIERACGIYDN
jgi:hypothetical protein